MNTLVLIKPGNEHLRYEIIARIRSRDLKITDIKVLRLDQVFIAKLYADKIGEKWYDELVSYLTSGEVHAMRVTGKNAIKKALSVKGKGNAGGIRGEYAEDVIRNVLHSSESGREAKYELKLFGF